MTELTLKTSQEIDDEILEYEIAYQLQFLHEQGLHKVADTYVKTRTPVITPKGFLELWHD